MSLKRLVVAVVLGFWLTGCGAPDDGVETIVVLHATTQTKIVYGYDAEQRVQFRIEGTDEDLAPLLHAYELGGHRIAYGGLCDPGAPADVAGPLPCPPGPKGQPQ